MAILLDCLSRDTSPDDPDIYCKDVKVLIETSVFDSRMNRKNDLSRG